MRPPGAISAHWTRTEARKFPHSGDGRRRGQIYSFLFGARCGVTGDCQGGKSRSDPGASLPYAELLHARYNLVLFDFRNHGQSSGDESTLGVTEQLDVKAVVDWLESVKHPKHIGLLGVAMGGSAVANAADTDTRIEAVILDSTHATLANALQAHLDRAGYPLSLPGAWAILLGGLLRTGEDMTAADPVQAVERYGARPLLILVGGRDDSIGPNDGSDLEAAARQGGAAVELERCAGSHFDPDIVRAFVGAWASLADTRAVA